MPTLSSAIVKQQVASMRNVEEALARQVLYGGDLATNLLELAAVSEAELTRLLAESHGLEAGPEGELPRADERTLHLVPGDLALRHGLYPLEERDGTLVIAVSDPLPPEVEQDLGFALGVSIAQRAAPLVRIRQAISRDYDLPLDRRTLRLLAKLEGRPDPSPSSLPAKPPSVPVVDLPRPAPVPPIGSAGETPASAAYRGCSRHAAFRRRSGRARIGVTPVFGSGSTGDDRRVGQGRRRAGAASTGAAPWPVHCRDGRARSARSGVSRRRAPSGFRLRRAVFRVRRAVRGARRYRGGARCERTRNRPETHHGHRRSAGSAGFADHSAGRTDLPASPARRRGHRRGVGQGSRSEGRAHRSAPTDRRAQSLRPDSLRRPRRCERGAVGDRRRDSFRAVGRGSAGARDHAAQARGTGDRRSRDRSYADRSSSGAAAPARPPPDREARARALAEALALPTKGTGAENAAATPDAAMPKPGAEREPAAATTPEPAVAEAPESGRSPEPEPGPGSVRPTRTVSVGEPPEPSPAPRRKMTERGLAAPVLPIEAQRISTPPQGTPARLEPDDDATPVAAFPLTRRATPSPRSEEPPEDGWEVSTNPAASAFPTEEAGTKPGVGSFPPGDRATTPVSAARTSGYRRPGARSKARSSSWFPRTCWTSRSTAGRKSTVGETTPGGRFLRTGDAERAPRSAAGAASRNPVGSTPGRRPRGRAPRSIKLRRSLSTSIPTAASS